MELTKQERKLAELSAKKYHNLLYRKSQFIGWIGAVLFGLGLLRILPAPDWGHKLLLPVDFL